MFASKNILMVGQQATQAIVKYKKYFRVKRLISTLDVLSFIKYSF